MLQIANLLSCVRFSKKKVEKRWFFAEFKLELLPKPLTLKVNLKNHFLRPQPTLKKRFNNGNLKKIKPNIYGHQTS
jgi:hypothetical protein